MKKLPQLPVLKGETPQILRPEHSAWGSLTEHQ
jgi:hypothetical protein